MKIKPNYFFFWNLIFVVIPLALHKVIRQMKRGKDKDKDDFEDTFGEMHQN